MSSNDQQPIIIKKVIKKAGGHHGGAWKVAYADFVTAMMAFFLLLWLLNVSTDEALETISSYFDPSHPSISDIRSGSGGVMGGLTMSKEGAMAHNQRPMAQTNPTGRAEESEKYTVEGKDKSELAILEEQLRKQEEKNFKEAQEALEDAIAKNPEMAELAKHLKIDITPEGLRIQIIDQEGEPMFPSGSADMYPKTRALMVNVADVIKSMPNDISVRGHTDSIPFPAGATYTNWELSADRANSSRRVLMESAIQGERIVDVMGKAHKEAFIEDDPADARNRRISIILKRETVAQALDRGAFDINESGTDENPADSGETNGRNTRIIQPDQFQKTPGEVFFP